MGYSTCEMLFICYIQPVHNIFLKKQLWVLLVLDYHLSKLVFLFFLTYVL